LSPHCAKAYFEYGNALLTKEEETSAQGVLGAVEKDKDGGNQEDEEVDADGNEGEGDNDEGGEDEENDEGGDEPEGDLQIAWEILDVRRMLPNSSSYLSNFTNKSFRSLVQYWKKNRMQTRTGCCRKYMCV
jgi:hypothetical protein